MLEILQSVLARKLDATNTEISFKAEEVYAVTRKDAPKRAKPKFVAYRTENDYSLA
jgi:hypothetical protein